MAIPTDRPTDCPSQCRPAPRGGAARLTSLAGVAYFAHTRAARVAEAAFAEAVREASTAVLTNDLLVILALVSNGGGVGLLPTYLASAEPRLVEVLAERSDRVYPLVMLWPASRHVTARLRAFLDPTRALAPMQAL